MASEAIRPQWSWGEGIDEQSHLHHHHQEEPAPSSTTYTGAPAPAESSQEPAPEPTPTQPPRRYYKPRTCRICLEVVQPSTELDDSLAGRIFASKAQVRYVSEDPELGRLMSPCHCKGSQKYVHEGCLQAWRNAAPMNDRNFWRCPTCQFEYRLERLRWGRWLSSGMLRLGITLFVMVVTVFILGFVADPIMEFVVDPLGSVVQSLFDELDEDIGIPILPEDLKSDTWSFHFVKGFLSLGLLGFLKSMLAMSPFNIFNLRVGGRRRRGRGVAIESVSWFAVVVGIITFLVATWKIVSHYSAKMLENASDRIVDVQQDDGPDEDDDDVDGQAPDNGEPEESRKDRLLLSAMHFAYPPRKTSNPPPYLPRTTRLPGLRRNRLKLVAITGLFFLAVIYLLTRPNNGSRKSLSHTPTGKPPVVLVTVLDENKYSKAYIDTVKENRIKYAEKHGYRTLFAKEGDYDLKGAPGSWTKVVAMRHALTKFPDCYFAWYLDQNAFIMNPLLKIENHVMKTSKLTDIMKKDHSVVPPDSIIKTFSHLTGQDVDFVLTQDKEGLSVGSFIIRNGDWARFFLETWFDPIYRSYNFQKAEAHALEHIVQWHPTILARLAIVDQKLINSYSQGNKGVEYKDGDIAVRLVDCVAAGAQACETESQKFTQQWRTSFTNS
ncbi:hypothetical protein QBC35DRAFT_516476 [Podospora australis]|uniref:RING-CH-type domain-containing protein n=1 Tax=Podospora australis TaxID=1536484 RepID=A0AAN7AEY6_9PEZI|nr:hypothetical protein QBC35DRAFT_516476 [Podospora australis]